MYIIVVGAGKVGYYLSQDLLEEGHEVLLIEKNPEKVERLSEALGSVIVLGDAAETTTLAEAGASRASVIIAVTGEDEDNLVVCQLAKHYFGVGRAVARVSNPRNEKIFRLLGIDTIVNQTAYIMSLIEQSIPDKAFVHLLNLRFADLSIVEARVDEGSAAAERVVGDLDLPEDCVIVAVGRGANVVIPTPTTALEPGDDVIAVTREDREDDLRTVFRSAQ